MNFNLDKNKIKCYITMSTLNNNQNTLKKGGKQ
ncbi:MAG: hypothetical protein Athens101410_629 [Parcubacteria group bacterium Athens1014_10]|nr:MAG: hypothetical protein Athens101410_629 [Parcubacteria group bacterium Athens1014_10]